MIRKVLHLVASGGLYGAESVILNLSKEMKRSEFLPIVGMIVEKGNAMPEIGVAAKDLGVKTFFFPLNFKFDPLGFLLLKRYLKENTISVVHSHGYKSTLMAFLPTLFLRIPLVVTCHLWSHEKDLKLRLYHEMEARIMRFLPAVVGVSKKICKEVTLRGVSSKRVKLIKNGINLANYRCCSKEVTTSFMEELKIDRRDFVIGTVGRLNRQKAQYYLIDTIKIIRDRGIDVKCIIFGEGTMRRDLEKKRDKLELKNIIHFPGFRDDILNILELTDVFVLTSIDEGLPMVLLEAMAMKKAIVSTPVGEISSIIHHGVNGFIYSVGDVESLARHIMNLKNNDEMRTRLGREAFKTFENHYTSEMMTRKYIDVYKEFLI